MIKALMPVNTDLESSIALRYAKMLSGWIDLMLHDLHIVEAERAGPPPGTGWVRRTWENALIENASQEIRQFLAMENLNLKRLGDSEILIGDKTDKLLESLINLKYQLFIEGILPSFDQSNFYSRVHSRLYRSMPCPALLVKNLVEPGKAALLVQNGDYSSLVPGFLDIFASSKIQIDLVGCHPTQSGGLKIREADKRPEWMADAEGMLDKAEVNRGGHTFLEGPAADIAEYLRAYGLVAASLTRNPPRQDSKLDVLAQVPSPVLICWSKS